MARGVCLATLGLLEEAQSDIEAVLAKDSANPTALKARGVLQARQGNLVEATLDFAKAIPLLQAANMPIVECLFNRGYARKMMHLTDDALADFESCLRLAPTNICVKTCLGSCLFLKRRWKEALGFFEQFLIARPKSPAAVLSVALCQYQLAVAHLDKAQQASNSIQKQGRADNKLRSMSKSTSRSASRFSAPDDEDEVVDLSDDDDDNEVDDESQTRKPLEEPTAWALKFLESAGGTQSVTECKGSVDPEVLLSATGLFEKSLSGLSLSLTLSEQQANPTIHTSHVSSSPRENRNQTTGNSSVIDGILTSRVFVREPGEGVDGMVLVLNKTARVAGQPAVCDEEITDGEVLYSRGLCNLCLGRLQDAESDFALALASNPQGAHYPHYRAIVHARKREYKAAVNWNLKALIMNEHYLPALVHIGVCLHLLDRHNEALHRLDAALSLNPSGWFIIEARGRTLAALDRHEEALEAFESSLQAFDPEESDETRSRIYMCIARSSIATHQPDLLRHALKQARSYGQDSASLLSLRGLLAMKEKKLAKAKAYMTKAHSLAPREPRFLFDRSRVHQERRDHVASISDMSKALSLLSETTISSSQIPCPSLNFCRGLSYLAIGNEARALEDFELASSVSPSLVDRSSTVSRIDLDINPEAFPSSNLETFPTSSTQLSTTALPYTRLIMDSGLWEGSKVIGGSPDPPDLTSSLYYHLGILRARAGRHLEARQALEVACHLLPTNPAYLHELAKCRQACADYSGAVEVFGKVIRIQPRNARAYFRRGLAYRSLGLYSEAADDIEHAKALDPKEPAFHVVYKRLEGVHVIELVRPGDEEHV